MAENIWDAKINVDIDAAGSQRALAGLVKGFNDLERGIEDSEAAMRKNEARIEHLEGAAKSVAAAMRKMDGAIDQSNSGLRQQAAEAQRTERAIRSLYQEYASAQIKMGKTPAKMSAWLPTSGIPASDLAQVSNANIAVNSTVAQALREQERAHEAAARAAERQAEATRRLRLQQEAALTKAQGRLGAENEAEEYRKLEASVGRAEAAKKRLAMAQREVNAAQNALRGAVGDIVAQTAATNRLADAKRKLAQAEVAARTAQQPVGNPDSARYALYDVAATAGTGAAIGGIAIGATIKNFALLESQFATVSRTSGETGHNLGIMTDELLDMGSSIPVPLKGLTDMAARAAQLGVEGQDNILAFTETMSKFAAVSDTVTETEVAEYFGRLNNLTGNTQNWEEMADAVAKVGVTSAATDQQVLKTAQEIAQAGAGANYSQKEIIGLAGAFASLAVPPERARSVLLDLNKIMTKGMGESTESMKALSSQMGISEDAIRGMWRAKPTELISEMAKSLKDMAPEDVMTFLSDFGLKGQRALPVFMAIAKDAKNAGEGLSVFDSAIASAENSTGELDRQFSITMETLTSAWQTFVNSLQALGFDAMKSWGPALTDVLNVAGDVLDWAREFVNSDIGGVVTGITLGFAGLATALMGVIALGAVAAASLLAIKSAAASGIFGAGVAGSIGKLGDGARTAGSGFVVMGSNARNAVPHLNTLGTNATRTEKAVAGLKKVGGGLAGVLGGPIGVALTAATAIGILGANAVATAQSYRDLGAAITAVDAETGKSMGSSKMLQAATQNFLGNSELDSLVYGAESQRTGTDLGKLNTKNLQDYLKLVEEGNRLQKEGARSSGTAYANVKMGAPGEVMAKSIGELGLAMSKMSSSDASVAFQQLWKDADRAGVSMDTLVTQLGGPFSDAFYEGGRAANQIGVELGSAASNTQLGEYMLNQYALTTYDATSAVQTFTDGLEEVAPAFEGTFTGMAEAAAATNSFLGGMVSGAAGADTLTQALVDLGVANGETGALLETDVDIYDEVAGKFNLTSKEAQAAVSALGAFAEQEIASIGSSFAFTSAMVSQEQAIANAKVQMDEAREKFITSAEAMGVSREAAEQLANQIGLIPGSKLIVVDASTATTAQGQVDLLYQQLVGLPANTNVMVTGLTADAQAKLELAGFTVTQLDGDTAQVTVTEQGATHVKSQIDAIDTSDQTKAIDVTITGADLVVQELDRIKQAQQGVGTVLKTDAQTSTYYPQNTRGNADGGLAGSARKFAGAGYTGPGAKWDPAGTVHRGEYIFPKRAVDQARGVPTQDSLGRMMQQHYPQAMAPTVVVQGGGQGGPVDLSIGSIQALAQAVYTQINIDGMALANNVNGQNRTSTRKSSN